MKLSTLSLAAHAALLPLLAALILAPSPALALHFNLAEGVERCFLEEVPEHTLVIIHYKNPDKNQIEQGGINIYTKNPKGELIAEQMAEEEGRFAFTSQMSGEHQVCLKTTSSHWFSGKEYRFHIRIDVGESSVDYDELAKSEHLNAIEIEIRKLVDKVKDIRAEQGYQKEREESFRNTSESTNARVMWWSIVQTIILLASGLWQIQHLKAFFVAKKLV